MSSVNPSEVLNDYLKDLDNRNNQCLGDIRKAACESTLSLCVGAGITAALVGTWNELLNELAAMRCFDGLTRHDPTASIEALTIHLQRKKDDRRTEMIKSLLSIDPAILPEDIRNDIIKELEQGYIRSPFIPSSTNVLEQGEYLMYDEKDITWPTLDREEETWRETFFAAQTQIAIQRLIESRIGGSIEDRLVAYFLEDISKTSSKLNTLAAVVKLCLCGNVREVITYNFDTILERLLCSDRVCRHFHASPKSVEVYSIHEISAIGELGCSGHPDTIRVYHVHGVLDNRISPSPIIFSENSYKRYQDALLNWSNVRIMDSIFSGSILCVGFSGEDVNFRMICRLFSQMQKNPVLAHRDDSHVYLTRCYHADVKRLGDARLDIYGAVCIKTYLSSVTSYFRRVLNTEILWSSSFDYMANMISSI